MVQPLLQGVAFISGAASGLGRSTAFAFARNGVRQLAIADINTKGLNDVTQELRSMPGIGADLDVLPLHVDTADETSIIKAHKEIATQYGRLDYGINNAGIGHVKDSTKMTGEEFRRILDINLTGVWLAQREQIRMMLQQEPLLDEISGRRDRGVIVNMASMLGLVAIPRETPCVGYVSSKHGVIGVTRADAIVYASQGVRINAMCPGYIDTPIQANAGDALSLLMSKIPNGRLGQPDEIAEGVVFLASPMSSYMHGATLTIDGGYTAQ